MELLVDKSSSLEEILFGHEIEVYENFWTLDVPLGLILEMDVSFKNICWKIRTS